MAVSEKVSAIPARAFVRGMRRTTLAEFFDREDVLGYMLLIPVLLILGVFVAYPFVYGVWLAFTDTEIGIPGKFIGLDNFARILNDSTFQQAATNSFVYTVVTTVFKLVLGLAMAAILNIKFRGNRFS